MPGRSPQKYTSAAIPRSTTVPMTPIRAGLRSRNDFTTPPRPLRGTTVLDGSLRKLRSRLRRLRSTGALRRRAAVVSADGSLRKLRSRLTPRITVRVALRRHAHDRGLTQVEVQPGAVRGGAAQRVELLRGGDQELLQLGAARDQVRRQHAEAGDAVLQRLSC